MNGYAGIVERSTSNSDIKKIISQIKFDVPTYSPQDLPDNLKIIDPVKPGSRKF